MSIQIGDIKIADEIIDLRYQVIRLSRVLDILVNKNPTLIRPTPAELEEIDSWCVEVLQKRYPSMGIMKQKQ